MKEDEDNSSSSSNNNNQEMMSTSLSSGGGTDNNNLKKTDTDNNNDGGGGGGGGIPKILDDTDRTAASRTLSNDSIDSLASGGSGYSSSSDIDLEEVPIRAFTIFSPKKATIHNNNNDNRIGD